MKNKTFNINKEMIGSFNLEKKSDGKEYWDRKASGVVLEGRAVEIILDKGEIIRGIQLGNKYIETFKVQNNKIKVGN